MPRVGIASRNPEADIRDHGSEAYSVAELPALVEDEDRVLGTETRDIGRFEHPSLIRIKLDREKRIWSSAKERTEDRLRVGFGAFEDFWDCASRMHFHKEIIVLRKAKTGSLEMLLSKIAAEEEGSMSEISLRK